MQYKTVYHARPDILWYITERENADKIMKKGIKPSLSAFELPGTDDEKAVCAVHLGEYDKARKLARMEDIEDPVAIEFIAKTYYECVAEKADSWEESEFINEEGPVHVGLCITLDKVKAKWITGNIKELG
ncbi:hypothetical protein bpr_II344 (plasmid) [Butyrivibrio proteoclasticus B316]|uniref:Uncharacterized protein n=1 Tax=Butyrivibrio proteoclasticus (strain ATCC 51982 / DSM 14932 / B316) TaxID=515622 RepID=E0S4E9_BUTPB|nr:hypothetical protein [Butyrivibrio proteoclasticus]ADL36281.1 hypothetical protein bpr_II344 [Butyrivibrio proteoclasticus B316]